MTEAAEIDKNGSELERRLAGLSPEQRARLERALINRKAAAEEQAPPITPRQHAGPAPLSYVQELLWLVHEMSPGTHAYNSSGARRLRGPLDVDALERAINGVIARHGALRTTFDVHDGAPVQIIHDDVHLTIEHVEVPGISDQALVEKLRELVRRPFDLRVPLLTRASLLRIGPEDHVLLTSTNHLVWDGWSKGIYQREITELYDAYRTGREPQLPELAIQYVDFAVWQREWLAGERMERQLEFWRERLAGAPPLLALPADRPRPAVQSFRGDRYELWFDAETVAQLRAVAQQHGVTFFMALVAIWATLLHRLGGQDEIVLGTPIAGRNRVEVEGLIGYFNNTLALRVDCAGDPSFAELLGRVREMALGAYANQDISFEHVVRELAPQRDLSYTPLFQSLIVLQNAAPDASLEFTGVESEMIVTEPGTAKFDLSLGMGEYRGRIHASLEYASDLFDRATVARIAAQLERLIQSVLAAPDVRLSALPLLSASEHAQIEAAVRGPRTEVPEATLHELFAARVAASPDAVAVSGSDAELTYRELHARSSRLAAALRSRGVGPGHYVGFCLDPSPDLIVALLGILMAGAACVPLDPGYPPTRLATMIEDAGLAVVVADDAHRRLVVEHGAEPVSPSSVVDETAGANVRAATPTDAAFVIFTSGSTGRPKGVVLEHRGLVNHALAAAELFGISEHDRTLQFASISFDISLEEIFCTLLSGATLVLRDEEMPLAGEGMTAWLERRGVTFLDLPTAFWHAWVRDLAARSAQPPRGLRLVVVGGEKASLEAFEAWRRLAPGVRWINTYGPTETSVVATSFEPPLGWVCRPGEDLPIGRPLPNVDVHVLDRYGMPVPMGVRGELHIGGAGLARGYLGSPELTAERFWTRPGADERLYRTGDLVRRRADATIEFLGRVDEQVKLRGFRIEPAEIEAALLEQEGVAAALVEVREHHGEPMLVGYVVPERAASAPAPATLRASLSDRLPAFAVPSVIVPLGRLPLTPNGKVDRDALPTPEPPARSEASRIPPGDDLERSLLEIWSELFHCDLGVTDDFFELGGHSMLAVRMLAQVEQRLGRRVRLAVMVRTPTIRGVAAAIREGDNDSGLWRALVPLQPDGRKAPLFLIHSLDGDVVIYRDLVRRLGPDQPVWGLETIGSDGRQAPKWSIPEMASHYIEEMRTVQPHGPYFMAGLCYGGVIAHEMACQLERAGEQAAFVGLIDSNPLEVARHVTTATRVAAHLRELTQLKRGEYRAFVRDTSAGLTERVKVHALWLVRKHVYFNRGRALPSPLNVGQTMELNKIAARGYETQYFGGRVTLFRLVDSHDRSRTGDRRMWWSEFAAGMDVYDVVAPGAGHISLLHEPHVAVLYAALEAALCDARASDSDALEPAAA